MKQARAHKKQRKKIRRKERNKRKQKNEQKATQKRTLFFVVVPVALYSFFEPIFYMSSRTNLKSRGYEIMHIWAVSHGDDRNWPMD